MPINKCLYVIYQYSFYLSFPILLTTNPKQYKDVKLPLQLTNVYHFKSI